MRSKVPSPRATVCTYDCYVLINYYNLEISLAVSSIYVFFLKREYFTRVNNYIELSKFYIKEKKTNDEENYEQPSLWSQ